MSQGGGGIWTGSGLRLSLIHDEGTYPECFAPVYKVQLGVGLCCPATRTGKVKKERGGGGGQFAFIQDVLEHHGRSQSSSHCPSHPRSKVTCSRLKVIGPRCSEEEELLHGGRFDLNVQLSNSGLQRHNTVTAGKYYHKYFYYCRATAGHL